MNENMEEVMLDLLSKQAVYGLTEEETRQLDELKGRSDIGMTSQSFEQTAAAISLANLDVSEPLPQRLQAKILADAEQYFDRSTAGNTRPEVAPVEARPQGSLWNWLGWAVAAAACVALAVNLWTSRQASDVAGGLTPTPTPVNEEKLDPSQMRQRLIESSPDLARANWGAGKMAELNPAGDVVWSDEKQAGYLRLTGLPKNDPEKETYQLWIIAENQDPKTPVDGGTFDINADGDVIIPIDAAVKVQNPQAFAITIEKPGGVVVSEQKKLAALAKRET